MNELKVVFNVFVDWIKAFSVLLLWVFSPLWGLLIGVVLILLSPLFIGYWLANQFYLSYKRECLEQSIKEFFMDFDVLSFNRLEEEGTKK